MYGSRTQSEGTWLSARLVRSGVASAAVLHDGVVRTRACLLLCALLFITTLTGCGDYEDERASLKSDVAALDHVASVTVGPRKNGELFETTKTAVTVVMDPDLEEADLRAVLVAAYDGINNGLPFNDPWIQVTWGGNQLTLEGTGVPVPDQVFLKTAEFARSLPRSGETTETNIYLYSYEDHTPARSRVVLHLAPSSRQSDILPRLDEIGADQRLPLSTAIIVLAADGGGLAGATGLPTQRERRTWTALAAVPFPTGFTVQFEPVRMTRNVTYTRTTVTLPADAPPSDPRKLVRLLRKHFEILYAHDDRFIYTFAWQGTRKFTIDSLQCNEQVGDWAAYLDDWIAHPTGDCPRP